MLREITAAGLFDKRRSFRRRPNRFLDRNPDRVKLMIPGNLLDDRTGAVILEHQLNGFGGPVAGPIAKQLMQALLPRTSKQ